MPYAHAAYILAIKLVPREQGRLWVAWKTRTLARLRSGSLSDVLVLSHV
jgi:hypothetical protein